MATASYKCLNCGAGLLFSPGQQKLKCDYCLSEFTIAEVEEYTRRMEARAAAEEARETAEAQEGDLVAYTCNSCGAEVVTEETTSATFCYYCHNPVLLTGRLSGTYRPQKVIPFAINKEKAIEIFKDWAGKRKFVPKDFTSASQLEKTTGLYLPHWMADYQVNVDYSGTATSRRSWVSGRTEYTEHNEYSIARSGTVDVNHVHEVALRKIDKELVDSITPYDESQATDFSLTYLSGFFAEKYDILQEDLKPVIENRVRRYADSLVQDTIGGYSNLNLLRQDLNFSGESWHYTLLPAWILTYLYQGKTFIYAINGQTGKIHGELPVDKKKLSLTSIFLAAAVMVLLLLGGFYLW